MSLYPTYIFAILFERRQGKFYDSMRKGLIYYGFDDKDKTEVSPAYRELEFTEKLVRKFLGVSLFNVWSWLIVYVYCHHQINTTLEYSLIAINGIFTLMFLYSFWFYAVKVKREIQSGQREAEVHETFAQTLYNLHYILFPVLVAGLCFFVYLKDWSFITIVLQLGICMMMGIYLVIFRTFRKSITKFSFIVDLLAYFRKFGIFALLYLIAINYSAQIAESSSPINIILLYFLTFYTIVIMAIKIYLYLKVRNIDIQGNKFYNSIPLAFANIKLRGYKWIFFIGIIYFAYASTHGNDLHQLSTVTSHHKIDLNQFYNAYTKVNEENSSPILYAAYGGGLKAHYWNLMILDQLKNGDKLNDILAMSGVSGGGMGIGNFTATEYLELDANERDQLKHQLRSSNILGLELSWLFGKDLIRSYIPARFPVGKDRSYRSMKFYTDKLDAPTLLNETSFSDVYATLFNRKSYYPNILINSTSTRDQYGIISGVEAKSSYPGAINLLDIKINDQEKSLTYFEALSTCNRFPIISPAANIPNKGHFLDGGYFENSGILSLLSFKKEIQRLEKRDSLSSSIFDKKTILVSVRNDKQHYLQSLLAEQGIDILELQNSSLSSDQNLTEVKAILGGIASLERLPFHIKDMLEEYNQDQFEFINIDLPYYIHPTELKELIGVLKPEVEESLSKIITSSNATILSILKEEKDYDLSAWGVVNPPTARILSKPVEIYMAAMMEKHPKVKAQLELLLSEKFE